MNKRVFLKNKIEVICEIANDSLTLSQGLKYRSHLGWNKGMLFIFPKPLRHSMHMINTIIPLEIIFIDEEKKIVDIKEGIPRCPDLIVPDFACKFALEVNDKFCMTNNIQIGDKVRFF